MFDFHAHKGSDDSSAFISLVREAELDVNVSGGKTEYSVGCLPWLDPLPIPDVGRILEKRKNFSVGECGLDKRYPGIADLQLKTFREMLALARDLDRMVVIHSVGRNDEIIRNLLEFGIRRAVFHSYTSSYEMAKDITRRGWWISLGPRALRTKDYGKLITLPFLLETDMETGKEQKETLAALYHRVSLDTGTDQETRLEEIRKEIWQQKDSF